MSNLKYVVLGAIILLGLILSPILGMAAQRAITVDSLEKGYKTRVTAVDTELAATNKAMEERLETLKKECAPTKSFKCTGLGDTQWQELNKKKNDLEFEKKSLVPAYNLLKESLR